MAVGPPGVPNAGWSFLRTLRAYHRLYRRGFVHRRRLVRAKSVVRLCAQVLDPQLWRGRHRKTVPAIALPGHGVVARSKFIQRSAARDVDVLVENATMLQMCAELGFHTLDMGSDVRRLVLDIESGCERARLSGAPSKTVIEAAWPASLRSMRSYLCM
jgi:hypothetical protein